MEMLAVAILIGVGVARVVEILKETAPFVFPAWAKSILATGMCFGATYLSGDDMLLVGLGSSGVAYLAHEVRSALFMIGDEKKIRIIQMAQQRVRR